MNSIDSAMATGGVFPVGVATTQSGGVPAVYVRDGLIITVGMVVFVGNKCNVLGSAESRVRHDRRSAPRLVGRRGAPVRTAVSLVSVERVMGAELVPHLMGHQECIPLAGRADGRGDASGLPVGNADAGEVRDPAGTGPEDVAVVVVRDADDRVQGRLVLGEHRAGVSVRIRVGRRVREDDEVVVRHEFEGDRPLMRHDLGDPVHGRRDSRQATRDGAAVLRGVLPGGGDGQPVGEQHVAVGKPAAAERPVHEFLELPSHFGIRLEVARRPRRFFRGEHEIPQVRACVVPLAGYRLDLDASVRCPD